MGDPIPEYGPSEDLLLRILRSYFYEDPYRFDPPPGSDAPNIGTLIPDDTRFPYILVRRDRRSGGQNITARNEKFIQSMVVTFETFCQGIEGDNDNTLIQEAIRHAVLTAVDGQAGWPDLGYLNRAAVWSQPARVSDHATSTGVVQYASLPQNVVRYESIYQMLVRPVEAHGTKNRFLRY